jgi:hypothetical protein
MVAICASGSRWLLRVGRVVWLGVRSRKFGDGTSLSAVASRVLRVSSRQIFGYVAVSTRQPTGDVRGAKGP